MKLSVKAKRNAGLIAITVVVIVAIILVIYFVQKNDADGKLKTGAIGQTVSTSQADVCVKNMRIFKSLDGLTAEQGNCFIWLSVEIKANKKIFVSCDKFQVNDGKNVTEIYYAGSKEIDCDGEIILQKGESKTLELAYEVQAERVASFYLFAYGARIDLGGTVSAAI